MMNLNFLMKKKTNMIIGIKKKSIQSSNRCRIWQMNMMMKRNTVMKDMKMNMKGNLKKKQKKEKNNIRMLKTKIQEDNKKMIILSIKSKKNTKLFLKNNQNLKK